MRKLRTTTAQTSVHRLFLEWLIKLNNQIRKDDQRIHLAVDNSSAHIVNVCLTHVHLEFVAKHVFAATARLRHHKECEG